MNIFKINGRSYDFSSVRCSGLPYGFDETMFTLHLMGVNFSDQITLVWPEGVHGIPLPKGRGTYKCSTSIEIVWDAWDAYTKKLAANQIDGYSDFDFDMLIQYRSPGKPESKVEFKETCLLGPDASHGKGGSNGLTAKIIMGTRYLLVNGVCSYPRDLDQDLTAASNGGVVLGV